MGGYGDVKLLRDDGKRLDGRAIDEMRPVTIEAGVLPAADGSAMVTHGLNVAVAAVYGPMEAHPRKIQRQDLDRPMLHNAYRLFLIERVLHCRD